MAARIGNLELVRLLLDNGADTETIDPALGETALHLAAMSDSMEVARLLIDQGANIEARDNVIRRTPLLYAAQVGSPQLVELMLDRGAEINVQDDTRDTPLHLAFENSPAIVELLLDRGADATVAGGGGITPCNLASRWEGYAGTPLQDRICAAAREQAVDTAVEIATPPPEPVSTLMPQLRPLYMEFNHQWVTETPLHRAVVEGSVSTVQARLAEGQDVNAQVTISLADAQWEGMTPLHLAALNPDPAVTEALLAQGANVNANAKSQHGLTPLHTAARLAGLQHVRALLNAGAQIEAQDNNGRTPLHWTLEGDPNVPALLLDLGANIEAKNNDGFPPLHWAAAYIEPAAFFLVRRAADKTATDNMGRTPCQVYGAANQGVGTSDMIRTPLPRHPNNRACIHQTVGIRAMGRRDPVTPGSLRRLVVGSPSTIGSRCGYPRHR